MHNTLAKTSPNFPLLPAAFAFIVLKDDTDDSDMVISELKSTVATKIAKYAVPDQIMVSGLRLRDNCTVSCLLLTSHN